MMNYPEQYTLLEEEEQEYLCGGSTENVALLGIGFVGNIACALLSDAYRSSITKKLQQEEPEKYQLNPGEANWELTAEIWKRYFTSAGGILITLGQVASLGSIAAGTILKF